MRRIGIFAAALLAPTLGLAACDTAETVPEEMDLPPAEEVAPVPEQPPEEIIPPEGAATLTVGTAEAVGTFLADAQGRALYMLEADAAGESTCVDACAETWPPFTIAMGDPATMGAEIQPDMLGVFERPDGQRQVTYNGHPLYFFSGDQAAGDINGQNVTDEWGEWYLVAPSGEHVEAQEPTS